MATSFISTASCSTDSPAFARGTAPTRVEPRPYDSLAVYLQRVVEANHLPSRAALMGELKINAGACESHAERLERLAAYCRIDLSQLEEMDDRRLTRLSGPLQHCRACARAGLEAPLSGLRIVRLCIRHAMPFDPAGVVTIGVAERDGTHLLAQRFGLADEDGRQLPPALTDLDALAIADLVNGIAAVMMRAPIDAGPVGNDVVSNAWILTMGFPAAFEAMPYSTLGKELNTAVLERYASLSSALVTREAKQCVALARSRFITAHWTGPLTPHQACGLPSRARAILGKLFSPKVMVGGEPDDKLRRLADDALAAACRSRITERPTLPLMF